MPQEVAPFRGQTLWYVELAVLTMGLLLMIQPAGSGEHVGNNGGDGEVDNRFAAEADGFTAQNADGNGGVCNLGQGAHEADCCRQGRVKPDQAAKSEAGG